MQFDECGLLITNEPAPGCYGDSAAETARAGLLLLLVDNPPRTERLSGFDCLFTDKGILRHPKSPWREEDTSEDQKLPLYLYLVALNDYALVNRYRKLDKLWFLKHLTGLRVLALALIFKFPYRWDDGKKSFQPSKDSSCDYLNFCAQIFYAQIVGYTDPFLQLAVKLTRKDLIKIKIFDYYGSDNYWLIDLYHKAIDRVWP